MRELRENMSIEHGLIDLANNYRKKKCKVKIKKYQKVDVRVYDQSVLKEIIDACKFKVVGNVYDFPEYLPQPESVNGLMASTNFELFQRVALSTKFNAVMFYSIEYYAITCMFLVDIKNLKKFLKILRVCLMDDSGANELRDTDFNCDNSSYIEITNSVKDTTKEMDVMRKKLPNENLVFEKESTINQVIGDIKSFFKDSTCELYKKLDLAYKRGIILYGDPGNGKSAMIRHIIRTIPDVSKIVINPNVNDVTIVLSALTKALNGKKAIIIIEDIDSLITDRNRSEFLNILDGVDIKSGVYFIGTTNYPDKIDPAFMNRSGRFDRTYKINNPSKKTRKIFFESRKLGELLSGYDLTRNEKGSTKDIIDAFVKYSDDMPMASLKEIITSTSYLLASGEYDTIKEALKQASSTICSNRENHINSHNQYKQNMTMPFNPYLMDNNNNMISIGQPMKTKKKKTVIDDDDDIDKVVKREVRKIKVKRIK